MPIVIFGIGSPIVDDVAETCRRLALAVAAWVRNVDSRPARRRSPGRTSRPILKRMISWCRCSRRGIAARRARRRWGSASREQQPVIDPTTVMAATVNVAAGASCQQHGQRGRRDTHRGFLLHRPGASVGHHGIDEFVSIGPARSSRAASGSGAAPIGGRRDRAARAGDRRELDRERAGAVVTRPVAPHTLVTGKPGARARARHRGLQREDRLSPAKR